MPPYFELEFIALIFGIIARRRGLYVQLFGAQESGKRLGRNVVSVADDRQRAALIGFEALFAEPKRPKNQEAYDGGSAPKDDLTAAQAQPDDCRKPHGCRRCDPQYHLVFSDDGAGPDEPDARQNAQRQTHEIHDGIGIVWFTVRLDQQIHLNHGDRGS